MTVTNNNHMMKMADFIKLDVDVDIGNDVFDKLLPAMVGPVNLTNEGKKHFKLIMDLDVEYFPEDSFAIVHIDGNNWRNNWVNIEEFFNAAAGYCSINEYDEWFIDDNIEE